MNFELWMVKIGSKLFKRGHCATLFFPVPIHACPCRDPASSPATPRVAAPAILALRAARPYPEHEPRPFNPPLLPAPARVELVEQSSSPASIPAAPCHPTPISTRPKPLRLALNLLRLSMSSAEPPPRQNWPAPPRPPLPLRPWFAPPSISYLGLRFLRVTTQIDCM